MEIEAGPVPQPETINVGFSDTSTEEADIERQLLEAEKNGTSLGEIEDARQKQVAVEDKPDKPEDSKDGDDPKPDNSETPAEEEKKAQTRDEKGKFVKDESKYEKAKKDAARKDTSWRALNEEKAQARAELERERAQLAAEREQIQAQAANRGQFSPQEYHQAAQEFQQAAWKAFSEDDTAKARELFTSANQCAQAAQQTWEYTLMQAREKDISETLGKHPELKDVDGEAGQAITRLINENPYLAQLPDGFSKAAQFLVAQRDAARVSELEGQIATITKERDEARQQLKAATSLAGAGSQTQPGARNFDDMSDEEQKREVERMFSSSGEFILA